MAFASSPFAPTHTVPASGLTTWPAPDPSAPPGPPLPAHLEVQVVEVTGGWTRIRCANDWEAWVDGRSLVPVAVPARPAGPPASPPAPPTSPAAPLAYPSYAGAPGAAAAAPIHGLDPRLASVARLDLSFSKPLVGAAIVAVSGVMPWVRLGSVTGSGLDVSIVTLFNPRSTVRGGASVGLLLLVLGVVAGVGAAVPARAVLRRVAGLAAVGVALLYCVQLARTIRAASSAAASGAPSFVSVVGIGVAVAIVGGLLAALAPSRRPAVHGP